MVSGVMRVWHWVSTGFSIVAHHVGMELADVHVQDTVEAQGCGQGEDHLGRPDGSGWCRWDIVIAR